MSTDVLTGQGFFQIHLLKLIKIVLKYVFAEKTQLELQMSLMVLCSNK